MWKRSTLPFIKNERPLVMAHRGNSAEVPENTMEAFKDAASLDVDVIETDVHLTADGKFVFFHDPRVDRTTDGKGRVASKTLEDLKGLDAGYAFKDESGNYPFRGKAYRIVSVEEVLSELPSARFNMDIKSRNKDAPRLLAKLLDNLGAGDRVMVGSFWQGQIKRFREQSDIPTSASIFEVLRFKRTADKWRKKKAGMPSSQEETFGTPLPYEALQIPEKAFGITVIKDESFVEFCHALGIAMMVWTINEPGDMRRLLSWGVDGIFTDKPALLLEAVEDWKSKENEK